VKTATDFVQVGAQFLRPAFLTFIHQQSVLFDFHGIINTKWHHKFHPHIIRIAPVPWARRRVHGAKAPKGRLHPSPGQASAALGRRANIRWPGGPLQSGSRTRTRYEIRM